jgi:hypothetical protein
VPIDWATKVVGKVMKVFGEPVTFRPAAGGSFTINGVFDGAYREVVVEDGNFPTSGTFPVLGVSLADFTTPPLQNDQLMIVRTGISYIVREVRDDSHGHARLNLNELSADVLASDRITDDDAQRVTDDGDELSA